MLYDHTETIVSVALVNIDDVPHVVAMLDKLDDYARSNGRDLPGEFLTAMIVGDFHDAVARADDTNIKYLRQYMKYIHNNLPSTHVNLAAQALLTIRDMMGGKAALNHMMVENACPELKTALRRATEE